MIKLKELFVRVHHKITKKIPPPANFSPKKMQEK